MCKVRFDILKVLDVYDAVKYDVIYNEYLVLEGFEVLYEIVKELVDCIVLNEYGMMVLSKLWIGGIVVNSLIVKLLSDLNNIREEFFVVESGGMLLNEMCCVFISEKILVLNEEDEVEMIDEEIEWECEE